MKKRVLTALVLIGVFVPLYFYIPAVGFSALAVLLGYGMLIESYAMTFGGGKVGLQSVKPILLILGGYTIWFPILIFMTSSETFGHMPSLLGLLSVLTLSPFLFVPLVPMLLFFRIASMFRQSSMFCARTLYYCQFLDIVLFVFCLIIAFNLDKYFLFNILCLVVGIDSVGYFVGKFWGKRHIFPTISPKKTLEGYLAALLWTFLFGYIVLIPMQLSILHLTLSLGMVYLLAITGDLLVSYQKRLLNIKDSGTLLPGHGGLLDRFDSWMFISAFVCYLVMIN